ncbi:MAG: ABC transporter substrate-binding protein [Parvibaculaceae bacterium]
MNRRAFVTSALAAASAAAAGGGFASHPSAALAQEADTSELRIGVGSEITTLDPHFYNLTPNSEAAYHVYDCLVSWDSAQIMGPGLAKSWTKPAADVWVFDLHEGVTFHDGTLFTADDVVFSIARASEVPNSPSSFAQYTARIAKAEAISPAKLRITTKDVHPYLLSDLTQIAVISRKVGTGARTEDYNSGKAAIGTGPYRVVEWVRGDRLVYERNDNYWGRKPIWRRVTVKPVTSPGARVTALLAGDVAVINQVPSGDIARLKQNGDLRIAEMAEPRLFYIAMDQERDKTPFATDKSGNPLERNPLRDARVRLAISKAMNRELLVERIMDGLGEPAGQLVPDVIDGASKTLKVEPWDVEGARKLLAEAGYPDGFGLTVHGPNDRYLNDARIVQAVAQMLTRIGIEAKVETLPKSVYFSRVAKFEFSFQLIGSSTDIGAGAYGLAKYVLHSRNAETGMGAGNRGHYGNPEVDALIDQASVELGDEKRNLLLQQATDIAIGKDTALIPLFYGVNAWATRKPLKIGPRSDAFTLAMEVSPST